MHFLVKLLFQNNVEVFWILEPQFNYHLSNDLHPPDRLKLHLHLLARQMKSLSVQGTHAKLKHRFFV